METIKICRTCQAPIPMDAPQGLCPKCLAQAAFATEPKPHGSGSLPTPPTPADLAPLFPQLEIIELVGQGGMGIVYKARQSKLDRIVALKILPLDAGKDPHFAERFSREARSLARLNHPNIVSVFDSGQAGGYFFFVMEFVDGTNLRHLMQASQITPKQALAIVPPICEALQYAHDEGIVHRDIKPENVLLDKKGRVKIADFGLAKLLGKDQNDFTLTASGSFMGTPKYMAPEQIENPEEVDHRADIYSLGVVFYEMLTGELPLGRFAAPSKKVQLDVRLDEVVLRTLEKEPSMRFQQASEIKSQVENISGLVDKLPAAIRNAVGFEYKSKSSIFGWPLIHVAYGTDLATGKKRVAKGIFAFGDKAIGVFASAGVAYGIVAFGGVAIGIFSLGGMGIGIFSFCGLGLGLLASFSGIAIAPLAFGGIAIGYYASGGWALGHQFAGGNGTTALGREFFSNFKWARLYMIWGLSFIVMTLISLIGPIIAWRKKRETDPGPLPAAAAGR